MSSEEAASPGLVVQWFKALNNPKPPRTTTTTRRPGTATSQETAPEMDEMEDDDDVGSINSDIESLDEDWVRQDETQAKLVSETKTQLEIANKKTPTQWTPFSDEESQELEQAYALKQPSVIVGEDYLFEVDMDRRDVYPIYWSGSVYAVTRAYWFFLDSSNKYTPVDEHLAQQIEHAYQKHRPWTYFKPNTATINTALNEDESASPPHRDVQKLYDKFKSSLFGPWSNHFVVFSGQNTAWLLQDNMTSMLTQALYLRLSSGENWGGQRLVRGYDNALKAGEKKRRVSKESSKDDIATDAPSSTTGSPSSTPKAAAKEPTAKPASPTKKSWKEGMSSIKHLVFVTHGIGQKLSEKSSVVNFVEDSSQLRKTFKELYTQIIEPESRTFSAKKDPSIVASPVDYGVMVIPVEWRKFLSFDKRVSEDQNIEDADDDSLPSVNEISLEGIPAVRNIMSDVLLDVLLYMEPRHRNDMLTQMIKELNRLYRLFIKRHPSFLKQRQGKVHIFAHSLGSIIAFDILCYHHYSKHQWTIARRRMPEERPESPIDLGDLSFNAKGKQSTKKGSASQFPLSRLEKPQEVTTNLHFPVDKFFAVGSPLGIFCLLKSKRIGVNLSTMTQYYEDWRREFSSRATGPSQDTSVKQTASLGTFLSLPPENRMSGVQKEIDQLIESLWDTESSMMHPDVNHFYSVFHPSDPVVYRVEPLISRRLRQQKMAIVPQARKKFPNITDIASRATGDIASKASGLFEGLKNSIIATAAFKRALVFEAKQEQQQQPSADEDSIEMMNAQKSRFSAESYASSASVMSEATATSALSTLPIPQFKMEEVVSSLNPRKRRIDFSLQEGFLDNPYLTSLAVHFNYWTNEDACHFVLREILEVEDESSLASGTNASMKKSNTAGPAGTTDASQQPLQ